MGRKRNETQTENTGKENTETQPETNGTTAAPKAVESKDAKFRRLINHRMPRALKMLTAIQNLSNRSQYEYTAEQADKIISTLEEKVKAIKVQLKGGTVTAEGWTL